MPKLSDVFGVNARVPTHTYVDRASLDGKLKYLLGADRHIILFGASKQGKTSLRRKVLPDDSAIIIQCRLEATVDSLYENLLATLGTPVPIEMERTRSQGGSATVGAKGEVGVPLVGKGQVSSEGELHTDLETAEKFSLANKKHSLEWIAEKVRESRRRVVIEDFHYLGEEEKRRFAFDLKTFWDLRVFTIVIGVWAEQNLLTYYNGDLAGRIEEVDLVWSDAELFQVLSLGEKSLEISFSDSLKRQIVQDAVGNVGLLQRIAERLCSNSGIFQESPGNRITGLSALDTARADICREEQQRYRKFSEAVVKGYKGYDESELKVYERIVRVCIDATDEELKHGLGSDALLKRVQAMEGRIRQSDLSAALNRLDQLQADRKISPLVLTYNVQERKVFLVDRELLFFRRYGNPDWPWQRSAEAAQDPR